jgi:hypothetical protein
MNATTDEKLLACHLDSLQSFLFAFAANVHAAFFVYECHR